TDKAPQKVTKLKIYMQGENCDLDFIKKNIGFADTVENRDVSQVEVHITTKKSEDGSREFAIVFTGRKEFENDNDRLTFHLDAEETQEAMNKKLAGTIKMGLMRYVGKIPLSERVSIRFMDTVKPTDVIDKWDFWVFSLSANTFLDGQELYKSSMVFSSISANRVTPELKVRLSLGGHYSKNTFTYGDTVIDSSSDSKSFNGLIVKSLNEHWSVGAYFGLSSSTYSNTKFSIAPAPAVEYNLFPYSESTKHQLRFLYRIGLNSVSYMEETIYQKTKETLLKESLAITLEVKQKWGTVSTSLTGSHYFHDLSKNRLALDGELSLRLIRGLNLNLYGSYSRIHDQISLVRGGASLEEILLLRKELETTYRYRVSIGLSYTFGSTQSNVVNPRFGTGGQSISISF
ncbi:MAG: hypothetical protein KAX11_01635, partial [Candidatus Aminicenantes bacterium]|nr:hypothetical protein [Candidatus Aminicenantes bacterium]